MEELDNGEAVGSCLRAWYAFENYIWMSNHYFFYICSIHEYCWNKCVKNDNSLIAVRSLLFFCMLSLCVAEVYTDHEFRLIYFANIGVYLTTFVSAIQLACAIKYKR